MKQNNAFVMRQIQGKHILMPVRANSASNDPILLNNVANDIWEACERNATREEIKANISESYGLKDDSPEQMAVLAFIDQLLQMGLLVDKEKEGK